MSASAQTSLFDVLERAAAPPEPVPVPVPAPEPVLSCARTPDPQDPFEQGRQACRAGRDCFLPGGVPQDAWEAWEDGWRFEKTARLLRGEVV